VLHAHRGERVLEQEDRSAEHFQCRFGALLVWHDAEHGSAAVRDRERLPATLHLSEVVEDARLELRLGDGSLRQEFCTPLHDTGPITLVTWVGQCGEAGPDGGRRRSLLAPVRPRENDQDSGDRLFSAKGPMAEGICRALVPCGAAPFPTCGETCEGGESAGRSRTRISISSAGASPRARRAEGRAASPAPPTRTATPSCQAASRKRPGHAPREASAASPSPRSIPVSPPEPASSSPPCASKRTVLRRH